MLRLITNPEIIEFDGREISTAAVAAATTSSSYLPVQTRMTTNGRSNGATDELYEKHQHNDDNCPPTTSAVCVDHCIVVAV